MLFYNQTILIDVQIYNLILIQNSFICILIEYQSKCIGFYRRDLGKKLWVTNYCVAK